MEWLEIAEVGMLWRPFWVAAVEESLKTQSVLLVLSWREKMSAWSCAWLCSPETKESANITNDTKQKETYCPCPLVMNTFHKLKHLRILIKNSQNKRKFFYASLPHSKKSTINPQKRKRGKKGRKVHRKQQKREKSRLGIGENHYYERCPQLAAFVKSANFRFANGEKVTLCHCEEKESLRRWLSSPLRRILNSDWRMERDDKTAKGAKMGLWFWRNSIGYGGRIGRLTSQKDRKRKFEIVEMEKLPIALPLKWLAAGICLWTADQARIIN